LTSTAHLKGIDIHVHSNDELAIQSMGPRAEQMARYFGRELKPGFRSSSS